MMKLAMAMLDPLPRGRLDRVRVPMLSRERLELGSKTHRDRENLTNLLICARNCGTCPSYPGVRGEALYRAGGRSAAHSTRRGCNFVTCPLYDQCSRYKSSYFCINGLSSVRTPARLRAKSPSCPRSTWGGSSIPSRRNRRLVLDDADISEAIHKRRSGHGAVGREVDSTILLADIRSFTAFSENTLPYDIVHILNRYFDAICAAIDRNGGYIDDYMAVFGLDP